MGAPQFIGRREFLARACDLSRIGLVGLVAAQWPARALCAAERVAGAGSWTGGRGIMLDKVTVSAFAECLGSAFRIRSESDRSVDVELIEATALRSQSDVPGALTKRGPFSIVFRGPFEPLLPQKIYTLEHDKLGRFELFLVPIGPDGKGMCYEAVFN